MEKVRYKKGKKEDFLKLESKDENIIYIINESGDFSEDNPDEKVELYVGDKKIRGAEYDLATETADGLMSADDKIKTNSITVDSDKNIVAKGFKGTLYGNADTATKVGHSLTITNGANSVVFDGSEDKVVLSDVSIPKFSRIEYNEISADNIVQGGTSLNGEIVYVDNLHPLSDGFYWYATDGKYYKWWNTAHLFKDGSSYVTLPNKIFECGEDGEQYVFLPTSYNDDGTAKYGLLLKLTDTKMLDVTYSELKNLVDNAKLIKGMQYRITDFVTTCNSTGALSEIATSSANHPFDIIVTADDNNTPNANARVCLHEGDTYFANNKLSEWVIKYDINNDTSKFQWADTTNGKGVIYYMQDEFGNETCYDFKNILFNGIYTFNYNASNENQDYSLYGQYCYENKVKGYYNGILLRLNANTISSSSLSSMSNNVFEVNTFKCVLGTLCNNNTIGAGSRAITLGDSCSYNKIGGGCQYIVLGNNNMNVNIKNRCAYITTFEKIQNVEVKESVSGTSSSILSITEPQNASYCITIAKNSSGVIKTYCEADLV
jgi:hypothetical protein